MKRLFSSALLPIIFLSFVLLALFIANYLPNTWLLGWDDLVPELNIWLNLKRSLFAVWQEYQGLGLVGGMGHATDLIRQIILLPFILLLPDSLIRYLWHYAMISLGTFAIYFGLKKHFKLPSWIATLSSLFYLLNFGSIQNFWAPFEAFSTFWGFFPCLIFSLWDYLDSPIKSNLKKLVLINLLTLPSFYVQTIFIVYILCISLIILSYFLTHKSSFLLKLQRTSVLALFIFLINSFWLLPFAYFLATNVHNPRLATGNIMSSEETFLRNQAHGTLSEFLILRGYYYDFPGSASVLMAPWQAHFSNHYFLLAAYLLSIFVIIGLVTSLLPSKQRNYKNLSVIFLFLLSCLALLTNTPPFSIINSLLRQIGILDQVFRSPFTKFVFPAVFSFTLLTTFGLNTVHQIFLKLKYSPKFSLLILNTLYLILLFTFSFPAFQGCFFYPSLRQNLPKEYLELIKYFHTLAPAGRIANLPQGSFWGWTNLRWGYNGSGFLWYGVSQPILDRAFDVWNLKNEDYYWDISLAVQQNNPSLFNAIFDKYDIQYLIFDDNSFYPDEKIHASNALSTRNLLSSIPGLRLLKTFGHISLYQTPYLTQPYLSNSLGSNVINTYQGKPINPDANLIGSTVLYPTSSSDKHQGQLKYTDSNNQTIYRLTTQNGHNLLAFNFADIGFTGTYLLKVQSQNVSGHPLNISAFDDSGRYKFFFYKLGKSPNFTDTYYLIPKMENDLTSKGLTILLDNPSFGQGNSTNLVKDVLLYPYNVNNTVLDTYEPPVKTYLPTTSSIFFYKINLATNSSLLTSDSFLVLPQSFSPGWLAFYFDGLRPVFLPGHTIANSWANAWPVRQIYEVNGGSPITIYILFWPQLLQFLGFGLLLATLLVLIKPVSHGK